MEITLIDFNDEDKRKLLPLARITLKAVRARMPAEPPLGQRPIRCYLRPGNKPRVIVSDDDGYSIATADHYRIHLSATNSYSGHFVYQFSHELGHVMLDPRRSNGVLEILAVAVSLRAIKDIAKKWDQKPPLRPITSTAAVLRDYIRIAIEHELMEYSADKATQEMFARRDPDELAKYASAHVADQDSKPHHRLLNLAGALALVADFPWKDLVGVARHTIPSPDADGQYREDLPLDLSALPLTVQTALQKIGR